MTEPGTLWTSLTTEPRGAGCERATSGPRPTDDPAWAAAACHARRLAWASLAWMTAEGVLGLFAGYHAKSVALTGWAFGSVVEGLDSIIVIWRLTGARTVSDTAERRAQRAVAVSFWLLAPQAIVDLVSVTHPAATVLGVALTATSLVVMPALGAAKHRLARRLDAGATAGEGTQTTSAPNYLCAAHAAAVLAALAVTATWPAGWWIAPAIALGLRRLGRARRYRSVERRRLLLNPTLPTPNSRPRRQR